MPSKITISLLLLSLIASNEALRILVCFPMLSKSHSILGHGVVDRLLEAGHEVVHVTSFPKDKPTPNLKEINVSDYFEDFKKMMEDDSFKLKNMIGQDNFGDSLLFAYITYTIHKQVVEHPTIIELFSDPKEKFDAVILEWFFSEINAGIPALFEAPLIWVCSTEPHWQALRLIDEYPNPAYSLDLFSATRPPLSFWQRVTGLYKVVKKTLLLELIAQFEKRVYYSVYPGIADKRGVSLPSYYDAVYNASLMFVNSHPSVGGSQKLPQNVINMAGYHINPKTKPLPQDLQKLMEEAKHGVIYYSMGSNVRSDGMSEEMKRSLLDMFSKFKETVIWKFESDMTNIPANVHLVKWAPQPSILAHPSLKLFITHGGQLSTTEAIHYGVPVVGVPVMADQHVNMASVESKGFGVKVTLAEDMAPELEAAIKKVLSDPSYKNRAKELSAIYHDREMPPSSALAHWVEHVVRTRGAPHLRSPALHVPFYQKLYLDLAALLAVVFIVVRKLVKLVFKKKSSDKKTKKKSS